MPTSEQLLAQAERRALEGDVGGAADLFEQAALGALKARRLAEATTALVAAARLRMMGGELDRAATLLRDAEAPARRLPSAGSVELLKARAELASLREPPEARAAAWRLVLERGGPEDRLLAHGHLADLASAENDALGAADHLTRAAELSAKLGDAGRQAALLVEKAAVLTAAGHLEPAAQALERAAPLLDRAELATLARHTGQRGMLAGARGDAAAALALATEARAQAVACADIPVYLAATWLIVAAHETEGRLEDALDTLYRARASLKDLLGPPGGELVEPALEAFQGRLGEARFAEIEAAWIAARRAARSDPGT